MAITDIYFEVTLGTSIAQHTDDYTENVWGKRCRNVGILTVSKCITYSSTSIIRILRQNLHGKYEFVG